MKVLAGCDRKHAGLSAKERLKISSLSMSQAKEGRHRCAFCAYEAGYHEGESRGYWRRLEEEARAAGKVDQQPGGKL